VRTQPPEKKNNNAIQLPVNLRVRTQLQGRRSNNKMQLLINEVGLIPQEQQASTTRRQQVRASIHPSFRGINYQLHSFFNTTDVGILTVKCIHCGALKFPEEMESLCCLKVMSN